MLVCRQTSMFPLSIVEVRGNRIVLTNALTGESLFEKHYKPGKVYATEFLKAAKECLIESNTLRITSPSMWQGRVMDTTDKIVRGNRVFNVASPNVNPTSSPKGIKKCMKKDKSERRAIV